MKVYRVLFFLFLLTSCSVTPTGAGVNPSLTPSQGITSTVPEQSTATSLPAETSTPSPTEIPLTASPAPSPTLLPTLLPNTPVTLIFIDMVDQKTGWGIESSRPVRTVYGYWITTDSTSRVVRTIDGGRTWRDVNPLTGAFDQRSFFALDSRRAWAGSVEDGTNGALFTLWSTTDGGQSWQSSISSYDENYVLNYWRHLYFVNSQTGWFIWDHQVADKMWDTYITKAAEGGKSMELPTLLPGRNAWRYTGIAFIDEKVGFLGSDLAIDLGIGYMGSKVTDYINGKSTPIIQKTIDGSQTWSNVSLPRLSPIPDELRTLPDRLNTRAKEENRPDDYYQIMDCDENQLIRIPPHGIGTQVTCQLEADFRTKFDYYYLSTDDGQNWHSWLSTGNEYFFNSTVGWRLFFPGGSQSSQLQQTVDAGWTWKAIKTASWQTANFDFNSDQVGWAIVSDGKNISLVQTFNGGKSWSVIKPIIASQ